MITLCLPDARRKEEFLAFTNSNKEFHEPWTRSPLNAKQFDEYIKKYQRLINTSYWIIYAGKIAGVINLNDIIRGVFQNAFLGYYGSKELSGKGVMQQGMKLVLEKAFKKHKLHRVECAIQPKNQASLKYIRKLGFHFEGYAPRYLYLNGKWRDHFKFSLTQEQWDGSALASGAAIISEYQESWPKQYAELKRKIQNRLGPVKLEHIGSTSVKDLPAKDIIDMQLGVEDFSEVDKFIPSLEKLGFEYVVSITRDHVPFKGGEYVEEGWHKRFFRGRVDGVMVNLHVRILHSKNWCFALRFRDFLRSNEQERVAYEQLKQRLAEVGVATGTYGYIKDPVCDLIYKLSQRG